MPRRSPAARPLRGSLLAGLAAALVAGCSNGDSDGPRLLLTSTFTDEVIALDPADGRVLDRFAIDGPSGVAVAPSGDRWLAATGGEASTAQLVDRGGRTQGPALTLQLRAAGRPGIDPTGARAFVPEYWLGDSTPGRAAAIDLSDATVTLLPALCRGPHQASWSPDGRWVAVPCALDDEVLLLDGESLAVRHRVSLSPVPAELDPQPAAPRAQPMNVAWARDSNRVWVTLLRQSAVAAIDTAGTELGRAPVPRGPADLALTPAGDRLLVPARDDFLVAVLDATTLEVVDRLIVAEDPNPHGVVISPDGSTAFVTREGTARSPGGVTALRIADGAILWRTEAGAFTLDLRWLPAARY